MSSAFETATIRKATVADAAACLAIYRPFVESTAVSFEEAVSGRRRVRGPYRGLLVRLDMAHR